MSAKERCEKVIYVTIMSVTEQFRDVGERVLVTEHRVGDVHQEVEVYRVILRLAKRHRDCQRLIYKQKL